MTKTPSESDLSGIGIDKIIDSVLEDPHKYARIIALRVLRLLQKQSKPDSIEGAVIACQRKPSEELISRVSEKVVQFFQSYTGGGEVIYNREKDLIAHACANLLGDFLHKIGYRELAHFVHDSPNFIFQGDRLALLNHEIIPNNPYFPELSKVFGGKVWRGCFTSEEYTRGSSTPNILALVSEEGDKFKVKTLLTGDSIHPVGDHVLSLQNGTIFAHRPIVDDPKGAHFLELCSGPCDIGSIITVESLRNPTKGWATYRLTGNQIVPSENQEDVSMTQSLTFCVCLDNPEISYTTKSKRYIINGYGLTIDEESHDIVVLIPGNTTKISYTKIFGHKTSGDGNTYFEFCNAEGRQKLTILGGKVKTEKLSETQS